MDLADHVEGIVHEPTQTEGRGVDLTVAGISLVAGPGRVDFGGGELEPADLEAVETELRNPDDDYGWWTLEAGQYLLEYNESLSVPDDVTPVLQTRDELLERGAFHPTLHVDSLGAVPLSVGGAGLRLKENARVSTLLLPGPEWPAGSRRHPSRTSWRHHRQARPYVTSPSPGAPSRTAAGSGWSSSTVWPHRGQSTVSMGSTMLVIDTQM